MYLGGRGGAIVPKEGCALIHVDTDGGELGRTLPAAVSIISDAAQAVHALQKSSRSIAAPGAWLAAVEKIRAAPSPHDAAPVVDAATGQLHPHHALTAVFAAIPRDERRPVLVVLDGGEAALWAGPVAAACKPAALVSSTGYLGFLGNGFGYALGMGVAVPEALVVLVEGDGSAGFHFMELDSFARHGVRVLTVVVNNACWGMSANGQELVYGETGPVSGLSKGLEFAVVAMGLGVEGVRCEGEVEEVKEGVRRVVGKGGPACVDLRVARKPVHPVTEAMVSMTEDPDVIVVPYYDNVPRPHYKL